MTDPAFKAAVERPDWMRPDFRYPPVSAATQAVIDAGVARTEFSWKRDAAEIARLRAALSSQSEAAEGMASALNLLIAAASLEDIATKGELIDARTALSHYRTLGDRQ